MRRFRSNRTDHLKIRTAVRKGKSGSGRVKLTAKQQFKLTRYAFLDEYQAPRGGGETLGTVRIQI